MSVNVLVSPEKEIYNNAIILWHTKINLQPKINFAEIIVPVMKG